jgi:glycosyltransferase involved in cell wall biosynthesis
VNVLVQSRTDFYSRQGGDTMIFEKTKNILNDLGVRVHIDLSRNPDVAKYDLAHLYGITRVHETYRQMKHIIKRKLPYVLTPIYASRADYDHYIRNGLNSIMSKVYKLYPSINFYQLLRTLKFSLADGTMKDFFLQSKATYIGEQISVVKNARMILPNSDLELKCLREELRVPAEDFIILPHGVETGEELINTSPDLFYNRYGYKDFVLCVGRIEPYKNQVNLMKALRCEDIRILFAGGKQSHRGYTKEFDGQLSDKFVWLGQLDRRMLFSAYKNAKVVVLPSWSETCGLPGLEGGLLNCNIVITRRGYTKWFYEDDALYCDPSNLESIRASVLKAYRAPKSNTRLSDRIKREFTWERAALVLKKAYLNVLERQN